MRLGPALFTAYRWSFSARKRMSMGRAVLASAGIAAGVTALIVVLGVMGGLQKGYIDAILEISSFHLRVEVPERAARSTSEAIAALPGVVSALEFTESELMALGPNRESRPVALTILSPHGAQRDQGFMRALGLGSLRDFPPAGGFYLGREAASALGLVPGDRLEVFSAAMDEDEGLLPLRGEFVLSGTFASGYYEYDSSLAFAASDPDNPLLSSLSTGRSIIGIKLADRWRETRVKAAVEALLPPESGRLQTWREYNRGFFGALRMEKSIMMILVGLIFIVVGINIFHALRRTIAMKLQDIAAMKAFGASDGDLKSVFVLEGLAIGSIGALAGTGLGLAICANVNALAAFAASAMRFFSMILGAMREGEDYLLFSPSRYYLESIPIAIESWEIAFIAFLAIASTSLASWAASRRVSAASPMEVLRDE